MNLARPSFAHFVARLRPCQAPLFSARRCLATFSQPRPLSLGYKPCVSPRYLRIRSLATQSTPATTPETPGAPVHSEIKPAPEDEVYHGPLTTTYRRLKIFSLSTLTLTFALTPLIFVIETTSSVPVVARFALAGIAMAASGVSTSLVAWVGRPYVATLRFLKPESGQAAGGGQAVEMTTYTLAWHKRVTTVYDTAFLVPTSRPFATWELAEAFKLPEAEVESARAMGLIPGEETIAETRNKAGELLGSWVVSWDEHGVGTCREVGKVTRYFNVHRELLSRPIH